MLSHTGPKDLRAEFIFWNSLLSSQDLLLALGLLFSLDSVSHYRDHCEAGLISWTITSPCSMIALLHVSSNQTAIWENSAQNKIKVIFLGGILWRHVPEGAGCFRLSVFLQKCLHCRFYSFLIHATSPGQKVYFMSEQLSFTDLCARTELNVTHLTNLGACRPLGIHGRGGVKCHTFGLVPALNWFIGHLVIWILPLPK